MVKNFIFKDRDGQTPLPEELQKGLIPKHIQTVGELDEYEEDNIDEGLAWLDGRDHQEYLKYGFWLKLHAKLFGNVWKWAGKIRENELANSYFKLPHEIWPAIGQLEKDIEYWIKDRPFSEKQIITRMGSVFSHPSCKRNSFKEIIFHFLF
jgi:fido (protein-threonine AMPylation protein)